jgi:hypothetical protein
MKINTIRRTELASQSAVATAWSSAVSVEARCAVKMLRAWFPSSSQTLVDILRIELAKTN